MESDHLKQLKIKIGIVKRTSREYESYQREIQQDILRIESMKRNGVDNYTIKKQEMVLQETVAMLPNTKKRLVDAFQNLQNFIQMINCRTDIINSEEWKSASETFEKVQEIISY